MISRNGRTVRASVRLEWRDPMRQVLAGHAAAAGVVAGPAPEVAPGRIRPDHAAVGKRLARRQAATACGAGQHERVLAPGGARVGRLPHRLEFVQLHALKAKPTRAPRAFRFGFGWASGGRVAGEWRGWSNLPAEDPPTWTDANPGSAGPGTNAASGRPGRRGGSGSGESGRIRAVTVSCDLEWSQRRDRRRRSSAEQLDSRYGHLHMSRLGRVPRGGEAGPERTLEIPGSRRFGSARTPEVAERAQVGGHLRPTDLSSEAGRRLGTGRARPPG